MSSGNFASFSGGIALCFCQPLSCFTRDSQKSLVVAIYSQTKSRNCQNLVVYYWHFKVKVISFLSLYKAWKVYKTVSCLLPSRSFPAQGQLYNIRETIFRMFFSCCCGIFEQVNDWFVVWCLILPVIIFWLIFHQYRHLLAQTQHGGVRVVFMLLCCHWACKCLMIGVWIDTNQQCFSQRFCYCFVVCVIPSLLQDLTTVYNFLF